VSRKKAVLLSLVVVCVIGAITALVVNKREEPRNVFEEMYYAEMDVAEMNSKLAEGQTKQKTPLSNTEYFDEVDAEYIDYSYRDLRSLSVKESPKEESPYALKIEYVTHRNTESPFSMPGDVEYTLKQKIVQIDSEFFYHGVKIELKYRYIVFREGRYDSVYKVYAEEEGLYTYYSGSIAGKELTSIEEFSSVGISEEELSSQLQQNLDKILNYWVDNYPNSKFKGNDFGMYDFGGKTQFSGNEKIDRLITLLIKQGVIASEARNLVFAADKTELYNKLEEFDNRPDFSHMMITGAAELSNNPQILANIRTGGRTVPTSGWLGDSSYIAAKPSLGNDDYKADLDAVNIAHRLKRGNVTFDDTLRQYYNEIKHGNTNRAKEFQTHYKLEDIISEINVVDGTGKRIVVETIVDGEIETMITYDNSQKETLNKMAKNFVNSLEKNSNDFIKKELK
jgi:hypothetical protein